MPEASSRIEELQRELVANPTSRQFYQLGELLRRDGRGGEAAEVLRQGLAHYPKYLAAWVSLGRALADAGDPAGAAAALKSAIELDSQNPVAWHLLGDALLGVGDRTGALDAMQKALALVPGDEVLQAAVDALSHEPAAPPAEHHEAAAAEDEAAAAMPSFEEALAAQEPPEYDTIGAAPDAESAALHEAEMQVEAVPGLIRDIPAPPPEQVGGLKRLGFEAEPSAPAQGPPEADPFAVTGGLTPPATSSGDVFADVFGAAVKPPLAAEGPFGGGFGGPTPAAPSYERRAAAPEPQTDAGWLAGEREIEIPEIHVAAPIEAMRETEAEIVSSLVGAVTPLAQEAVTEPPVLAEPWEAPQRAVETGGGERRIAAEAAPVSALAAWLRDGEVRSGDAARLAEIAPPGAPGTPPPVEPARPAAPPATITLVRLYIQQQDFPSATTTLERMLQVEPTNQEARDLLELVRDMMGPMPEALPPLASKERKIAALQRWAASLTLGQERMGR